MGGFFKIDNSSLQKFLNTYFGEVKLPFDISKLNVSPKILLVAPGKKLSWQSHEGGLSYGELSKGRLEFIQARLMSNLMR